MTAGILIRCKGPCGNEVPSAELDSDGWCPICDIASKVSTHYEDYKRVYRKKQRYDARGIPNTLDKQLSHIVGRIASAAHRRLPVQGAIKMVNEITERARAEVDGHQRILTVRQALTKEPPRQREQQRIHRP